MALIAVLCDIVSIQKYIFASNRLKENLGASHIIKEKIYNDFLKRALSLISGAGDMDGILQKWRNKDNTPIYNGDDFGIGYKGGGNALLFFREKPAAEKFIREWTKLLLVETPGLQTAVALKENFDVDNRFESSVEEIHRVLRENKNRFHPVTLPYKFGITADCLLSQNSAEIWYEKDKRYISSHSYVKLSCAGGAINFLRNLCKDELGDKFTFTDEIHKLGQREGEENYIAVVHIDGNFMGERFKRCKTLSEIRSLSISVADATEKAFKELASHIIRLIENEKISEDNGFAITEEGGRKILPVRPIIIGGDDITFVCDGRLGVHFAEKFIEFLKKEDETLSACAGDRKSVV